MGVDRVSQWIDVVAACYDPDTAAAWDQVGLQVRWQEVDHLALTDRTGGFGHTDAEK